LILKFAFLFKLLLFFKLLLLQELSVDLFSFGCQFFLPLAFDFCVVRVLTGLFCELRVLSLLFRLGGWLKLFRGLPWTALRWAF
jgi:hypothetical protein